MFQPRNRKSGFAALNRRINRCLALVEFGGKYRRKDKHNRMNDR